MDSEEHQRVKHINVKYFFIRDHQELRILKIVKVHLMITSRTFFFKPLPKKRI